MRALHALLWYGGIFVLSQSPGMDADSTASALAWVDLQDLNGLVRLAAHLFVFGVQGVLVARIPDPGFRSLGSAAAAAGITLLLGIGDELHQAVVPGRYFRWFDVTADTVGALLAIALVYGSAAFLRSRSHGSQNAYPG
jgi:VanZ family protein